MPTNRTTQEVALAEGEGGRLRVNKNGSIKRERTANRGDADYWTRHREALAASLLAKEQSGESPDELRAIRDQLTALTPMEERTVEDQE